MLDGDSISQLKPNKNNEGVVKLLSWEPVLAYWLDQPPHNHLHIIVKVPSTSE